ncbi:type VII secretion protein EccB [Pseudonocardia sp. MH-G8]|uniref:type VII secretion protein EccB n=1 Tax=Pseudonocardia sp. MH-G8 TaxID=1854588 RepID=UPI000BA012CC|nr:type VII secretion protein EccB [Pseudonocardia sp. MH-G8]OZM78836.1 type VII secretion protein EccB [Pseudonocardia sp. MH-G8]
MQSRRDQVQAYFFVVGRMVAAVTHGRPDALVQPNRRASTGIFLGVLLAAIIAGVFGIYGLFVPGGNNAWRTPGAVIAAKETGARYLFLEGQLRPVLNYASARLAGGSPAPVVRVSTASLADAPTGRPIGIPGAPDSVPAAGKLDTGAWTVCARPPEETGVQALSIALLVGRPAGRPLGDDRGLLVSSPDGVRHLLWQGRRHRVPDAQTVRVLGYDAIAPVPVTAGWLDTVPAGRDLGVPATTGAGQPGPVIEGRSTLVGQVFAVRNPALENEQLYLLRLDGVTPLSESAAALVLAAPSTAPAYPQGAAAPIPIGPAALTGVPVSRGEDLGTGLPARPPTAAVPPAGAVPCARHTPGSDEVATTIELRSGAEVDAGAVPAAPREAGTTADRVSFPTGGGVLARDQGAAAAGTFLVTDTGIRYPIADEDSLKALGYSGVPVTVLPSALLDLLPTGPLLSTTAARADAGA